MTEKLRKEIREVFYRFGGGLIAIDNAVTQIHAIYKTTGGEMKALSIRQPWAWLIVHGYKDIENRTWPLPRHFSLPQRIYVHTGRSWDANAMDFIRPLVKPAISALICYPQNLPRGAIIGEVDILDCVSRSKSQWFFGPYGFLLANPVAYEKPIPMKGHLGFFEVEQSLTVR